MCSCMYIIYVQLYIRVCMYVCMYVCAAVCMYQECNAGDVLLIVPRTADAYCKRSRAGESKG